MSRGIFLWRLGVPIPTIVLLLLFGLRRISERLIGATMLMKSRSLSPPNTVIGLLALRDL